MATMIKQTKEEISWEEIARAREMGVLDKLLAERDVIRFNLRERAPRWPSWWKRWEPGGRGGLCGRRGRASHV